MIIHNYVIGKHTIIQRRIAMNKIIKSILFSIFCLSVTLTYHNSVHAESTSQIIYDDLDGGTQSTTLREYKDFQVGDSYVISEYC